MKWIKYLRNFLIEFSYNHLDMKIGIPTLRHLNIFLFVIMIYNCSEDPLTSELGNNGLNIDTLTLSNIDAQNYNVAPNLGTNERLYLGMKNGLEVPVSFIQISNSPYWTYFFDSTIVVDSLRFIVYSNDSLIDVASTPNLYFQSDSQFDENSSTYLDFSGFSNSEWTDLGQPFLKTNSESDTSSDLFGDYLFTELVWDIDTLLTVLSDTLDSNQVWSKPDLVRSFAMQLVNSESNFIELFSEEATIGDKDPKIVMYYRRTYQDSEDSTIVIDTSRIIYSDGDLSIIKPVEISTDTSHISLSNGMGKRSLISLQLGESFLPIGSVIRSADLILSYDTTLTSPAYNVIIDPIENDSMYVDSTDVYDFDPFEAIGYPYRVSTDAEKGLCILSIKDILQNITLGNVDNLGFKLIANEKNDPFESIEFEKNNDMRIEIIYVSN